MKLRPFLLLFLVFTAAFIGAQTIHEPNNEIYKDIDRWLVQGYVKEFLPLIRPYPAPLIDKILNDVISNGDADAREKAARYMSLVGPKTRFFHPGISINAEGRNSDFGFTGAIFAEGLFRLRDFLSVSYNLSMYGITDEDGESFNVPGTYSPYPDFVSDVANIGPVEIRQVWTSMLSTGKDDFYFQAGAARTSFGPFYDNGVIVGPQAPRAGHFSLVYWKPRWSFEMLFQTLTATNDFGEDMFASKYNIIHSYNFRLTQNLEVGLIQSLVWGGNMKFLYLVPLSYLFASQALNDFEDNAFLGLFARWRPIDTLLVNFQVFIDDFPFNDIFNGNQKYKLAGEIGTSWAPKRFYLSKLDFDYTAVFPYCYTHWTLPDENRFDTTKSRPNYLNYTHMGRNLGPDLEPNSDRFSIRTLWNFLPNMDMNVSAYLIRHGNASDSARKPLLDPSGENDGTIFDDGCYVDSSGTVQKNPYEFLNFLTQDVLDTRLGGTLGLTWTFPTSFGTFKVMGEYGAEYGWNRGLIEDNNGLSHYWSIGGMWTW